MTVVLDQLPDLAQKPEVPFMVMATAQAAQHVDRQRVLEAVIIATVSAILIGAAGYLIALPVIQERLDQVRSDVRAMREEMERARDRRDAMINRLDDRLRLVEMREGRR